MAQLPIYEDSYWNSHFLFESAEAKEHVSLIGQDLRQAALVNTFMPLLYGHISDRYDPSQLQSFAQLLLSFRAPISGKRNYLVHRFFGEGPKGKLLKRSLYEQGAFQVHRDFCTRYEASCEGCPFVKRVQSLFVP